MSGIDQVIARARQGNVGFSERKQFKLARKRAIEKLRRFALADPYFYVLELIQAAVAGGADYVDIACGDGDVLISWTGGVVREDELAQLFDFLFASKERVDLAHVRSLALGVNALLLFEPDQIVIESGDGKPGGTTRMVVRSGAEQVDVGRADGVLTGTYVRATGLDRRKVAAETGRDGDDDGGLEYATIETRCLSAPVPLVFNGHSLFGWARQRVPNLFGYAKVCSFDEGDLYGTVGLVPVGAASFQLLTHGVWIQTYEYDLLPHHKVGGVICFDRLHKTVDHSGFVRDDRFTELWVRLRPYAEQLVGGKLPGLARITSAEGLPYTPTELRELLRERSRIVIVPTKFEASDKRQSPSGRAKAIARELDAELLRADDSQLPAIRVLGDRELLLWRPFLATDDDAKFYAGPKRPPPAAPYLLPPAELEPPTLDTLVEELVSEGDWSGAAAKLAIANLVDKGPRNRDDREWLTTQLRQAIGETGRVRAILYHPSEPGSAVHGLLVRVTTTGRLLGQTLFASAYPGRILEIELPTARPALVETLDLARPIAERFAARSWAVLRDQDQRALAGLTVGKIEAGSPAARLALEVLSRVTVTRLRQARPTGADGTGGRMTPGLSFSLLRPNTGFDPFSLPLLRTVAGTALSLRELALMCDQTGGLVYGTIPEVPAELDGLDRARILALDIVSERILISLLGDAGYVRVDARDVIAKTDHVQVRDIAIGLREYPEFPLLLEGDVSTTEALDDEARERLVWVLVAQLRRRMLGQADEIGGDPLELEEHRRQAVRHLQWYVCREYVRSGPESLAGRGLLELPLFIDLDGEVWGLAQVVAALRAPEGLLVHYGQVFGKTELGSLSAAASTDRASGAGRPSSLALSCFGYRLLAPLGRMRLAFDFDLDDVEAARNPMTASAAFLIEDRFAEPWGAGVLGIPATRLPEYRVQLRSRELGAVAALDEVAHVYGVVGSIELNQARVDESTSESIIAAVDQRAAGLLSQLVTRLAEFDEDPRRRDAALRALLTYAGEQLTAIADRGDLTTQVTSALATRILGLPLFDIGLTTLVSGQRMLERFRREFGARLFDRANDPASLAPIDWSTIVVPSTPAVIREWLDAHLQPAAVIMPASRRLGSTEHEPGLDSTVIERERCDPAHRLSPDALAWNLEHWLARLRPDRPRARQTKVWLLDFELPSGTMTEGGDLRIELWLGHPLVERALAAPTPANLGWLLLAVYAHINEASSLVSNDHEAEFHLIVGSAIAEGQLYGLNPAPDELFDRRSC